MPAELDPRGIDILAEYADACVHCGLCTEEFCNARPTSADIGTVASMALEHRLAEGDVDFDVYLPALHNAGFDGFLTIEREVGDNPVDDIAMAVGFLKEKLAKFGY